MSAYKIYNMTLSSISGGERTVQNCSAKLYFESPESFDIQYQERADKNAPMRARQIETLSYHGGIFSVQREMQLPMNFALDTDFPCCFKNEYGEIELVTRTNKIENEMTDDGGRFAISYSLLQNGSEVNSLTIEIIIEDGK